MSKHFPEKPLQRLLFPSSLLKPSRKFSKKPRIYLENPTCWNEALPMLHPNLHLGLCSFSDSDWKGTFFSREEQRHGRLKAYAKNLSVVEIDRTFYGIPKKSVVDNWREQTPTHFRFSLKFPKEITHEKLLLRSEYVTKAFLEIAARLENKLGPLLLQFPYKFRSSMFSRLAEYLEKLPKNFRYVVEIRHRSWLGQPFFRLLQEQNIALCLIDHPFLPRLDRCTSDFLYVRWLGDPYEISPPFHALQKDPTSSLRWWAMRLWPFLNAGYPVFAFANNYYAGHAPETLQYFSKIFRKMASLKIRSRLDQSA